MCNVERRAKSSGVDSGSARTVTETATAYATVTEYFEIVDWQGLKLPSAERSKRDSLKSFERSVEVWKDWIRLEKELATLGEELPPAELSPAQRKKQSPDPTKKDTSKEEFGRRALAGGNMWDSLSCLLTLLKSFDKNNPEMGIDSVARQMHQRRCSITGST